MGGVRVGILGTEGDARTRDGSSIEVLGGGDSPGSLGVKMGTAANRRMARQTELDGATVHGARPGAQYGDFSLDTTVV